KILGPFLRTSSPTTVLVSGTAGIGKSCFLVYLAIRLLIDDNIVVYHTREGGCPYYCFIGTSVVRCGTYDDFEEILGLPETWYLVDDAMVIWPLKAMTVIALSPKSHYRNEFQEVDKRLDEVYYLTPWSEMELEDCQKKAFPDVPEKTVQGVYGKIGGV